MDCWNVTSLEIRTPRGIGHIRVFDTHIKDFTNLVSIEYGAQTDDIRAARIGDDHEIEHSLASVKSEAKAAEKRQRM